MIRPLLTRILNLSAVLAALALGAAARGEGEHRTGVRPPTAEEKAWLAQNARELKSSEFQPKAPLPSSVANLTYLPVVQNQGQYGTCAAFAISYYYKTYQEAREHGWVHPDPAVNPERVMSPFFTYNLNDGGQDGGMSMAGGMRTLLNHGNATWQQMPYHSDRRIKDDYATWPSEAQWRGAIPYRAKSLLYIDTTTAAGIAQLKQHLADGDLAAFSLLLHSNIGSYPANDIGIDSGVMYSNSGSIYTPPGLFSADHALTLVGYDDHKAYVDGSGTPQQGAFLAVNSWGGLGGSGARLG